MQESNKLITLSHANGLVGRKDHEMKVRVFTRLMNDHGTAPRVRVINHTDDAAILVYEGDPRNMDEEIQGMRVNSFTVLGTGFAEIHTK